MPVQVNTRGVGTGAIGDARSSSAEAMGIDVDRQERLQHRPEGIGDAKTGGGPIIGRASPLALGVGGGLTLSCPRVYQVIRIGSKWCIRQLSDTMRAFAEEALHGQTTGFGAGARRDGAVTEP